MLYYILTALAAEKVLSMRKIEIFLETIFLPTNMVVPSGNKVIWVPSVDE